MVTIFNWMGFLGQNGKWSPYFWKRCTTIFITASGIHTHTYIYSKNTHTNNNDIHKSIPEKFFNLRNGNISVQKCASFIGVTIYATCVIHVKESHTFQFIIQTHLNMAFKLNGITENSHCCMQSTPMCVYTLVQNILTLSRNYFIVDLTIKAGKLLCHDVIPIFNGICTALFVV